MLPCVSKVKPYHRVQSTAIFHNLVHNASSMPSLLLCQWEAGKVNWEDSKNCEFKISPGVPSGELKAAMLWRQTIVLRISKSGNALDLYGTRTHKLESGQSLEIPNMVRTVISSHLLPILELLFRVQFWASRTLHALQYNLGVDRKTFINDKFRSGLIEVVV